ncbi:uncharacterized protein KQ657_002287 [Scheffersomyces spartinae]|uniref:D-xylose 1-dehydrogenase (NADP(+), D-xylono-1,5-lactone-forming) n=1 Tax=Scheffersomyces spartinae TaxID=45513 RepID=A0A9P8AKH3_9ASCO|nr:uncharacterized protein KQ657_002287 [Scheffersomyces spartinae]KAG7195902.1 hypothetical protein KQ657_002287 [Scheffersomyces spartinae]
MSSSQLRWGIVGCGIISGVFARDLVYLNKNPRGANKIKHVITRVASRSPAKGQEFIEKNIDEYYDDVYGTKVVSYEDIQIDPEVDILYIGLPHTLHHSFVIEAITRGKKHILCEKPVTVNSKQLELILDAARENNVFFMEAVWVRYFPLIREVQKILYEDKKVGDVKRIFSDLSVDMKRLHGDDWVPSNRVADKKLGGGALLDITIYPITYSRIFMDPQSDPKSNWKIVSSMVFESLNGKQEDEVDFCTSFIISDQTHKQQATGISSFSSDVSDGLIAKIDGELGSISIYSGGIGPAPIKYHIKLKNGQEIEKSFEDDLDGTLGYIYEAIECGEMIVAGEKQSSIMSWNESQLIMSILDDIRKQNSLSYEVDL